MLELTLSFLQELNPQLRVIENHNKNISNNIDNNIRNNINGS